MKIKQITQLINEKLAGETLHPTQLLSYMDDVIDEINTALSSCFPTVSEFAYDSEQDSNDFTKDYNVFPERYIRSVLILGAAYKFYVTDEEGSNTAQMYQMQYKNNLFNMVRDYIWEVPEEYQNTSGGFVQICGEGHPFQNEFIGRGNYGL